MLVLCGMTCSGKSSVEEELVSLGYKPVVLYTTRPMRDGEIDGKDYHFISNEKFDILIRKKFFADVNQYTVASGDIWSYGVALEDVNDRTNKRVVILPPASLPKFRSPYNKIVLLVADEKEILNRLRKRGSGSDSATRRLEADKRDFRYVFKYIDFAIRTDKSTPKKIARLINKFYEG